MTTTTSHSNPFSTRFVLPAANRYLFRVESELSAIISRLQANGYWGQIIGPHGSGKTTLLHALRAELSASGRQFVLYELHDGGRRLPSASTDTGSWNQSTLVIVDGYEQLSWWSRRQLKAACRRQRCGLIVTAHSNVGLPQLYETKPSEELAQTLVASLMQGQPQRIDRHDVSREFSACRGDVREMLFRLYDLFEQRS